MDCVVCAQEHCGHQFCRMQRRPCLGRKSVTAPPLHSSGCKLDPEGGELWAEDALEVQHCTGGLLGVI